jgi:type VI secretion system protein ImpG
MDARLLRYYNQELQHLRETGAEFADAFPKIAARLGMEGIEVSDPYVERLLEGVAFLAARVQLKLDAEFPKFTQRLLEIVYPNYLAPTPSMLVAQFQPNLNEPNLAHGVPIPRGTAIRSLPGRGDRTACEFRTGQDLTLWPIEIAQAEYFTYAPDLPLASLPIAARVKSGVRLRLRATGDLSFAQIELESLRIFLSGADEVAFRLYELCAGSPLGILIGPATRPLTWQRFLPAANIQRVGYDDAQALLPAGLRMFQGYRLLQEYFAFAQRFLFIDLNGIGSALRSGDDNEIELVILFERAFASLENVVDRDNLSLHCAPAINLFPKRTDRIHTTDSTSEFHVVADRTRPLDYEIFDVTSVTGYGAGNENEQTFRPFYAAYDEPNAASSAYFTLQREPRLLSEAQARAGFRSSYIGSEAFISLVDTQEAPFSDDLRQLAVTALCTNRDLPLQMPLGTALTDFILDDGAPVSSIRCLKGPSRPHSPVWEGGAAWRFISHLALNHVSLLDVNDREGAAALREMLGLYITTAEVGVKRQVEGVRSLKIERIVRRLPAAGPITFGRGLRLLLEVDELAFEGGSAFLFGCVMEQFFARYVSINSFTETVLRSDARGEIKTWPPRWGQRLIV